jgi:pimeloyl-ACP methyl ester carboxylesterase
MKTAILSSIKILFSLGSKIAPKTTGRLAFRLFCTTFKGGKKSPQYQALLSRAQLQFTKAKLHMIAYSGGKVAAYEFSPSFPTDSRNKNKEQAAASEPNLQTVILVHGWQSQAQFMNKFIEPILSKGFRVIAIDLPGHGKSSGHQFHLPLAVSAMHAVLNKLGGASMMVSHSLGGAVLATTLAGTLSAHPSVSVSKAVLISSPDSMNNIFNGFASTIGLGQHATDAFHKNVKRLTGRSTEEFDVSSQLQQLDADILLVHSTDDKEVPFSEATAIADANETYKLIPLTGLGHRRIIASDEVVELTVDFIGSP